MSTINTTSGTLLIMEQVDPSPPDRNRFRIVEMYPCVDGIRTRMTENSFSTVEEARHFVRAAQG